MQIGTFRASPAREKLRGFIVALNAAVQSVPTNSAVPRSGAINSAVELLDDIGTVYMTMWICVGIGSLCPNLAALPVVQPTESIVDACPPIENPCRFGNKAFKTVHERLTEVLRNLFMVLPIAVCEAPVNA